MGYVYRYTDNSDGIIKYVGIVWSEERTLLQRIREHEKEDKFKDIDWKIEYICEDIKTRTDAEYMESHYISLYQTDKYLNIKKSGWGVSRFIPNRNDWILFDQKEFDRFKKEEEEKIISEEIIQRDSKIKILENKIFILEQQNNILKTNLLTATNTAEMATKKAIFAGNVISNIRSKQYISERYKQYNPFFEKSILNAPLKNPPIHKKGSHPVKCIAVLFFGCEEIESREFESIHSLCSTLNISESIVSRVLNNFEMYKNRTSLVYNIILDEWDISYKKITGDQINIRVYRNEWRNQK